MSSGTMFPMSSFRYEGLDMRNGTARSGSIRAANSDEAKRKLALRHVAATRLEKIHHRRTSTVELINFLEGLALLHKSGVLYTSTCRPSE